MADFYVHLSDAEVAGIVKSATDTRRFAWFDHALEAADSAGRMIGKREPLEPLDDGLRTVIEGALEIALKHDPGRQGLIVNLRRLDAWLQRYPARGRAVAENGGSDG